MQTVVALELDFWKLGAFQCGGEQCKWGDSVGQRMVLSKIVECLQREKHCI